MMPIELNRRFYRFLIKINHQKVTRIFQMGTMNQQIGVGWCCCCCHIQHAIKTLQMLSVPILDFTLQCSSMQSKRPHKFMMEKCEHNENKICHLHLPFLDGTRGGSEANEKEK